VRLPTRFANHNLLPSVRQEAIDRFARGQVAWHHGPPGPVGLAWPSSHLLDSQVQCVNALRSLSRSALLGLVRAVEPAATGLADVDGDSPVAFEWCGSARGPRVVRRDGAGGVDGAGRRRAGGVGVGRHRAVDRGVAGSVLAVWTRDGRGSAMMENADPPMRTGLKRAIAWRTLSALIRLHPTMDLRIVESHPCGGMYDCLTLVLWPSLQHVCSMNLVGSSFALGSPIGPRRRGRTWGTTPDDTIWRYPLHGLGEDRDALAVDVSDFLGMPRGEAAKTRSPSQLALAVIGELLDRVALGSREVDVRSGWRDGDGWANPKPAAWAAVLPAVAGMAPDAPWQAGCRAAVRYWSLERSAEAPVPAVVVDVASSAVWFRGTAQTSLAARYQAGAGVRAMAWWLEEALDAA
jgi:hypothetical protein